MRPSHADPTYYDLPYVPVNTELSTSFRNTYYVPPVRARKVSDPAAAVDFLYSTIERAGSYYSPLLTIASRVPSYTGSKVSYRDVTLLRNKLVADGVLQVIRQGGWSPTGGKRSVYRLSESLYRRLVWNAGIEVLKLGSCIIRTGWDSLSADEQAAYIEDHCDDKFNAPRKNKNGDITNSAWKKHYTRSSTCRRGVDVTDSAILDPLHEINNFSTKQVWSLSDGPLVTGLEKNSNGDYVEGPATRRGYAGDFIYVRIYTDNTSKHGRFYCDAQNLPKVARRKLVVNGEQTVELDFKAMHPTMFLQMSGCAVPDDVYMELVNWNRGELLANTLISEEETAKARTRFKLVVNVGINAANSTAAVRSLTEDHGPRGDGLFADRDTVCAYYNAAATHPLIGPMLSKGLGLGLMNLDAKIMESVMLQCYYENIPFLAVHDSVVVPARCEADVAAMMTAAYTEFVGSAPKAITSKLGAVPESFEQVSAENWSNPYFVLPGYQIDNAVD